MQKHLFFKSLLVVLLFFSACKKLEQDEQENINLVTIKLGNGIYTWSDTDGAGGTLPKIDTIKLTPSSTFSTELTLQDGSVNLPKDFTPEIIAEKEAHLFVYKILGANMSVSDLSKDGNNKDFGQTAILKTTTASSGTLQIILKHLPDKFATDPSKTGETDIDVVFPVIIK